MRCRQAETQVDAEGAERCRSAVCVGLSCALGVCVDLAEHWAVKSHIICLQHLIFGSSLPDEVEVCTYYTQASLKRA